MKIGFGRKNIASHSRLRCHLKQTGRMTRCIPYNILITALVTVWVVGFFIQEGLKKHLSTESALLSTQGLVRDGENRYKVPMSVLRQEYRVYAGFYAFAGRKDRLWASGVVGLRSSKDF